VVREVGTLVDRLVTEQIHVRVATGAKDASVLGDAGQIEQILMNLATNARDAMPEGGSLTISPEIAQLDEVKVRRLGLRKASRYVRLVVKDTGHGMEESTRARIFEPFFTTKEVGKGTGLGLATVFALTKELGGGLEVTSQVGWGTVFTVTFPCCEAEPDEAAPASSPRPATRLTGTALLVEDERDVREALVDQLRGAGLAVIAAEDAIDAQRLCRRNRFDVVVTDVVMPGMPGTRLAALLRSKHHDLPVLFISANRAGALAERSTDRDGAPTATLAKPFTRDELVDAVRGLLGRATQRAAQGKST
jgi:CheY-like chemotaxis protein